MATYIYPMGIFFNPCTARWGIYIYPMVIYIYPMGIHIYLGRHFSTPGRLLSTPNHANLPWVTFIYLSYTPFS